jgi:heat shock protein HtpX
LNRDELQGVIAHETAHIVNRDVLFMTTLGIMLGTVVLLADAFWRIIFRTGGGRRSAGKGGYAQLILFLIAIVLVIIAPIATRLIYFAISRKREYLADACGAQLTRYPEGLASALEKIAAEPQGLKFVNRVTAPMFIANPYKPFQKILYGLEGTHPPIEERIRILHSMGGGASIADYQRAWLKMRPTADRMGLLFSKAAITKNANIPAITAAAATPATSEPVAAARKIGDVLWKKNRYSFIDCECGVRLKIPPDFHSKTVRCPKCRSRHDITERIFLSA